jgi:hypothetical protein
MADAVGAPLTITVLGVAVVAVFGLLTLLQPALRRLR